MGVPVLSMHAPFEVVSKLDVYMAHKAFTALLMRPLTGLPRNLVSKSRKTACGNFRRLFFSVTETTVEPEGAPVSFRSKPRTKRDANKKLNAV